MDDVSDAVGVGIGLGIGVAAAGVVIGALKNLNPKEKLNGSSGSSPKKKPDWWL